MSSVTRCKPVEQFYRQSIDHSPVYDDDKKFLSNNNNNKEEFSTPPKVSFFPSENKKEVYL